MIERAGARNADPTPIDMTESRAVQSMAWEIGVPVIGNRHMLGALAKAFFGAPALVTALVGLLLGLQGEWRAIPGVALLLFGIGAAMFATGLAVAALLFRNRLHVRITVDGQGVVVESIDRAGRAVNRASVLAGLILGSAALTGSGLLATAGERQGLRWSGAFRAVVEPATLSIALRNGWRTLLRVHCLPGNFEAVVAFVHAQMALHGTLRRAGTRSPLGAYLARTLAVVLASLPFFAVRDVYGFGLLPPLLLLCFAAATVWFVRPMAWVVLGVLATLASLMVIGGVAPRASALGRGVRLRYETISGDDWAITAAALAGGAVLAWLAVATLRRRIRPALDADLEDAGER